MRRLALASLATTFLACASGPPAPAPLDTRREQCAFCRMAVSDARYAAQLAAPAEEPKFFDDAGCLAAYLKQHAAALPKHAAAFVADHRTKAWVSAASAVYTKTDGLETPMASHLIAHADASSRDADAGARGGAPMSVAQVFGASPPAGR